MRGTVSKRGKKARTITFLTLSFAASPVIGMFGLDAETTRWVLLAQWVIVSMILLWVWRQEVWRAACRACGALPVVRRVNALETDVSQLKATLAAIDETRFGTGRDDWMQHVPGAVVWVPADCRQDDTTS